MNESRVDRLNESGVIVGKTIAVWFSCGAASAVAAKMTVQKYGATNIVRVINNPVKEEDADNIRFKDDVSKWIGVEIESCTNPKFPGFSAEDVWEKRRYMSGVSGAPCTYELKKKARQLWEASNNADFHVLGFTADEIDRHERFIKFERANVIPVLIDSMITKRECFEILHHAGINRPRIYDMGYPNANCIGCVKAQSPTYWNHVRKMHPDIFASRAKMSDRFGVKLVRLHGDRIALSQLPEDAYSGPMDGMDFECGLFCEERISG